MGEGAVNEWAEAVASKEDTLGRFNNGVDVCFRQGCYRKLVRVEGGDENRCSK